MKVKYINSAISDQCTGAIHTGRQWQASGAIALQILELNYDNELARTTDEYSPHCDVALLVGHLSVGNQRRKKNI